MQIRTRRYCHTLVYLHLPPCAELSPTLSFPSPSVRPSIPSVRPSILKSSSSCPNMLSSAAVGLNQPRGTRLPAGFELLLFSPSFIFCYFPPALFHEPASSSLSSPSGPELWGPEVTSGPRPRALTVVAVRPELETLYKKMNEQNRGEGGGAGVCDSASLCVPCVYLIRRCVLWCSQVLARPRSPPRPGPTASPATVRCPTMPFSSISLAAFLKASRCGPIRF